MNEPEPVSDLDRRISRPVFISYATTDRKRALAVCKAIESRGTPCWISTRDVAPGENYQEAIVHSIRNARAVVLIFSAAANNSDEIKKELSLASRYRVPVMALRIEDVEPSDAFAYELSTRQWIDAFAGWDKSIDSLVGRIGQLSGAEPVAARLLRLLSAARLVLRGVRWRLRPPACFCWFWRPGRGGSGRTLRRRTACRCAWPGSNGCPGTCLQPLATP